MINYFVILNNCNGSQYGIGTYVKQIFEGLKQRNYSLSVIEMSAAVKEFVHLKGRSGISTYKIPVLNIDMEAYCRLASYLLIQSIPKSEKMVFHFNFIHHEPLMHHLREHYSGCRIIFTVHYLGWCFNLNGNYLRFKRIINSRNLKNQKTDDVLLSFNKEKIAFNSSDEVVVLSEKTRTVLINDYKVPHDKVHLIRNGLSRKVANTSISKLRATTDEQRILFVGRLDEQKGLKMVLKAFHIVADKQPSAKLYIIGNGDFNSFLPLCEEFRNRIIFTGKLSCHALNKIYDTATLGLLPSYHEQCSYTVIEMMKYGIPLITSDRMENLMDNSECVVSIPYVDKINTEKVSMQLSEKILAILTDKDKRQELSDMAKKVFENFYTRHQMIAALNDMIVRSFNRENYLVPNDYLSILDQKMFSIILKKPDIDFQFYGMGGICAYLWYRIEKLRVKKDIYSKEQFYDLQKFLLFYVDWLDDMLSQSENNCIICSQLPIILTKVLARHFYKTKIQKVLGKMSCDSIDVTYISEREIVNNAIKICNCNI